MRQLCGKSAARSNLHLGFAQRCEGAKEKISLIGRGSICEALPATLATGQNRPYIHNLEQFNNQGLTMETVPPIPNAESQPPQSSLWARLANIFATPGEVFGEIKNQAPSVANWLVPALILMVAGMLSSVIIFSQPNITQQIREQQQSAFEKQVSAGKMTQVQADQAMAVTEKFSGPGMMKLLGCVGAVASSFVAPFWSAFVLWLIARFYLKVPLGFMKVLEVAGLTLMIVALGTVVKTLLIIVTGNLYAAPGLILLVKHFDPRNPVHNILALADGIAFWLLAARSIGLAKLTGATFGKTAAAVFGIWLALSGLLIGFSLAMQAIFAK